MKLIPDTMDFSAYMRDTECKAKVRPASIFEDEFDAEFGERSRVRRAAMFSTKLRNAIEFRPGEVTTWAGYNGHRKSMFTGQVALDLCVQREPVLAISLEMLPRKTLGRMVRQAMATDVPTRARWDEFMRWTDGRLWMFDHVGRLQPALCLAVCRYFADELKGRHVFIDSLMKVCQSEESLDEQKQLVGDLCDVAKETGLHIHLVAHCKKPQGHDAESRPPTKYDIRGSSAISDQSHNVLMVWANKAKQAESEKREPKPEVMVQPDAIVTIDKQRNGSVEGKFGLFFDSRTLRFVDDATSAVEPYQLHVAVQDAIR
jgi:twinkle protein